MISVFARAALARPIDYRDARAFSRRQRQAMEQLPKRHALREPRLIERKQRAERRFLEARVRLRQDAEVNRPECRSRDVDDLHSIV